MVKLILIQKGNKMRTIKVIALVLLSQIIFSCNNKVIFKKEIIELVAKSDIREIISVYSYAWDNKKIDMLTDVFSNDATWSWYRIDGTKVKELSSRSALKNHLEKVFSTGLKEIKTRHFQTNTLFLSISENEAKTVTPFLVTRVKLNGVLDSDNAPNTAYQGHYEDDFIKINGKWKFKSRKLVTDN